MRNASKVPKTENTARAEPGMRERLSSLWTFVYRVIFPAAWITGFGIGTIALWLSGNSALPSEIKLSFLFAWVIGSIFILWFAIQLRIVWLEGDHLLVVNFHKKELIPLRFIQEINETRFWNPKTIKIMVQRRPNLPEEVVFIAPVVFQLPFGVHPVVKRLSFLVEERKKNQE